MDLAPGSVVLFQGDSITDAGRARDRWTWVSLARSRAASSLEQQRAVNRSGFYHALPHQQETP